MEHHAVADDVVHAVHQREEHGHEQADEDVSGDVKGAGEVVFARGVVGEIERPADERGERGRDEQSDEEIAAIAHLRHEGAAEQRAELRPLIVPANRHGRWTFAQRRRRPRRSAARQRLLAQVHLLHVLKQAEALVLVPPVIRRETARRHQLALRILLENDVAAQIAQRSFQHVEDELRARRAARRAAAQFRAEVLLVLRGGEVGEHLARRAVEDHAPAFVQQQRLGKHLEQLRGRLMDRDEDDLVVRHRANDLDDVLAVLRAQAAGRLVEEITRPRSKPCRGRCSAACARRRRASS